MKQYATADKAIELRLFTLTIDVILLSCFDAGQE